LGPNSVLGLWKLIPTFSTAKTYIFFIYLKFLIDGYITRPYWFLCPNSVFGLWGLFLPFWPLKVYFFLLYIKLPIDGYITRPYWFLSPNSVFGLWGLFLAFWSLTVYVFFVYTKFPIDCWFTWPYSMLSSPLPPLSAQFFGLRTLSIKISNYTIDSGIEIFEIHKKEQLLKYFFQKLGWSRLTF
jgi:hypothetical protein